MKAHLLAGIASLALALPAVAQTGGTTPPSTSQQGPAGSSTTGTDTGRSATPSQPQSQSPSATMPGSSAQGTPPATSGGTPSQQRAGVPGTYMTAPMQGQFMVSNLMDRTIYGSDGNSLGDVNDVLIDGNGQIAAVVIGVGGFLGIGEKDVAVPLNRLNVVHQQGNRAGGSGVTSGTPGGGNTSATGATGGQQSGAGPGGTGQQSSAGTTAPGLSGLAAGSGFWSNFSDDARLVLNATRDELRNAPTFRARGDAGTAGNTPRGNGTSGRTGTQPQTTR